MNKINNLLALMLEALKPYHFSLEPAIQNINDNINTIDIYDTNNQYLSTISIKPYNQIIDIPPIYQSTLHIIKPILLIREDATTIQIIHEICHLLSIGSYKNYYHTLGINEYFYDYHYHCIHKYEHYYLNEWMNDIMTSYFMKTLFDEEFHYLEMDELYYYMHTDINQLVDWYFNGQVNHIRNIIGDYDALYLQITS